MNTRVGGTNATMIDLPIGMILHLNIDEYLCVMFYWNDRNRRHDDDDDDSRGHKKRKYHEDDDFENHHRDNHRQNNFRRRSEDDHDRRPQNRERDERSRGHDGRRYSRSPGSIECYDYPRRNRVQESSRDRRKLKASRRYNNRGNRDDRVDHYHEPDSRHVNHSSRYFKRDISVEPTRRGYGRHASRSSYTTDVSIFVPPFF